MIGPSLVFVTATKTTNERAISVAMVSRTANRMTVLFEYLDWVMGSWDWKIARGPFLNT